MYANIDKEAMRFVHVHDDLRVVKCLCELELPHVATATREIDRPEHFADLTMLELRLLYKNTTGAEPVGYYRPKLLDDMAEAARTLAPTPANLIELLAQCSTLKDGDTNRYRYVRGALRPAPVDELFTLAPVARTGTARPMPAVQALESAPLPTPAPPAAAPAVRAASPRPAAGGGSVADRIFAACDAALAALGPGATLEAARKQALVDLEAAGVNMNSARKGSSMWVSSRR